MSTLPDKMIEELKSLASRGTANEDNDDFNPMDHFGGNFDDTYDGGVRDGQVDMAREVLTACGIEW